jgi:hypothetical protein
MKFFLALLSALVIALSLLLFIALRANDARFAAIESKLAPVQTEVGITMAWMQRWTDKLRRAAEAGHWELASFYLHEIEETAEGLIAAKVVDEGHNISELLRTMLMPAIESLEQAAEAKDAALFDARYIALIQTCNACHVTTDHAAIRIAAPSSALNPWNQDFRAPHPAP